MTSSTTAQRMRRGLAAVAAAMIGLGAPLLLATAADAQGKHHQIEISQYMYMPMSLTIEQGETVTWTNKDQAEHDVMITSGPASFQSPMLAKGDSWSHTFAAAGPYSYICSVHPDMKATITVEAKSVVPTAPASSKPTTTPSKRAAQAAGAVQPGQAPGTPVARAGAAKTQAAAAPVAQTAAPQLVSAPQSSATLQPLILVVGASVMAVVFCLLLMASRPVAAPSGDTPTATEEAAVPKHLDEA